MKRIFTLIIAAVATFTGCIRELSTDSNSYHASTEKLSTPTRTAMGKGHTVEWSSEDRIAIFEGSGVGKAYQLLGTDAGKSSGEFIFAEGLVTEASSDVANNIIAAYPFNEKIHITDDKEGGYMISGISFPEEQTYSNVSFDGLSFPMIATAPAASRELQFKNIGSIVKISLTGSYSVSRISLTGNSGEPLAGAATVILGPDGIPSVQMSPEASKTVTLICDPAIKLDTEKATEFHIAIPPTDFASGLSITVTDSMDNNYQKEVTDAAGIMRSVIFSLPSIDQDGVEEIVAVSTIAEYVVSINECITPLFSESDNIMQLATHLDYFKTLDGVQDIWTTNTALYIMTKGGLTLSWTYTPEEMETVEEEYLAGFSSRETKTRNIATRSIPYDGHDISHDYNKVCIINQQYNDDDRKTYLKAYDDLADVFENNGFGKVKRIDGAEADLDFFTYSLTQYDIIFLVTHGNFDGNNHWIATGEEVTDVTNEKICNMLLKLSNSREICKQKEFYGINYGTLTEKRGNKTTSIMYVGISDTYIKERMQGEFKNTIIFNTACQSLMGNNKLASAFLDKGASLYLGYDDTNTIGKEAGPEFFNNMIDGMTVEEAFNKLPEDKREQIFYDKYKNLCTPTLKYLPEANKDICISHLTPVTKDTTIVNGKIRLNGTFKTPVKGHHSDYYLGFCYSYTTSTPTTEDSEVIDVENGHGVINDYTDYYAVLKDIRYNETCYYRFFFQNPHSGEYVYGDTQSFMLEMDQWGDLGLSVLWAAWNVGANSPEGYGGYYAWGETEEKSTYTEKSYEFYDSYRKEYEQFDFDIDGTKYDVAHVKWGNGARMPNADEIVELSNVCEWTFGSYKGVNGWTVTGPSGESIFLPSAGYKNKNGLREKGEEPLYYWSSHCLSGYSHFAIYLRGPEIFDYLGCFLGFSVRPVKDK